MRLLPISLLIVVLTATIGLGWIFDFVFESISPAHAPSYETEIQFTQQLGATLAKVEDRNQFVQHWQKQNNPQGQASIMLTPIQNFPLPSELKAKLLSPEPLILESQNAISIHYYLAAYDEVFTYTFLPPQQQKEHHQAQMLFTSLFYLLLVGLLLLWLYPLARRLLTLRQTAKDFGNGQLHKRLDVGSISYISDIEQEFNAMAQRIESLVNDMKLLSNAVSHELRTPLARIRFGIETLAEEDNPAQRGLFQKRIIDDVDNMVELVESLLRFARLDQNMLQVEKKPVELNALLHNIVKQNSATDKVLNCELPKDPSYVEGDAEFLAVMVNNLVQNALLYSQHHIHLSVSRQKSHTYINIEDDGPGIPEEKQTEIIQPFVRGLGEQKKGFGLGLAIVKRIVDWHKGRLLITRSPALKGARFSIQLVAVSEKFNNFN